MKVLPILFNTEMVRAILNGRKTVTRRICKDGNDYAVPDMQFYTADRRTYAVHSYADIEYKNQLSLAERPCPICPGDILYVRETWQECEWGYVYRAWPEGIHQTGTYKGMPWRPSITDEQAAKEGCDDYTSTALGFFYIWDSTIKKADIGRYGWDANPWVWVIEFSRCERPDENESAESTVGGR